MPRATVFFRDEILGARPKASLDGLPGLVTTELARKSDRPFGLGQKRALCPPSSWPVRAAPAAKRWRPNHPVFVASARGSTYSELPFAGTGRRIPDDNFRMPAALRKVPIRSSAKLSTVIPSPKQCGPAQPCRAACHGNPRPKSMRVETRQANSPKGEADAASCGKLDLDGCDGALRPRGDSRGGPDGAMGEGAVRGGEEGKAGHGLYGALQHRGGAEPVQCLREEVRRPQVQLRAHHGAGGLPALAAGRPGQCRRWPRSSAAPT